MAGWLRREVECSVAAGALQGARLGPLNRSNRIHDGLAPDVPRATRLRAMSLSRNWRLACHRFGRRVLPKCNGLHGRNAASRAIVCNDNDFSALHQGNATRNSVPNNHKSA